MKPMKVNGFDAPRFGARGQGSAVFGSWKLFKDITHGLWEVDLFDEMGNRFDSCKCRTRDGCMNWLNQQEVVYANTLGR